jgi:hypothetical protein
VRWCVGENRDIGGGAKWPKEPIEVVQKVESGGYDTQSW